MLFVNNTVKFKLVNWLKEHGHDDNNHSVGVRVSAVSSYTVIT